MLEAAASAELNLAKQADGALLLTLSGRWSVGGRMPSIEQVTEALDNGAKSLRFDTRDLKAWDSGLLNFVAKVMEHCMRNEIAVESTGLPGGVLSLLRLAEAVPERTGVRRETRKESFLHQVGIEAIECVRSAGEIIRFLGDTALALLRMLTGRARYRFSDLMLIVQQVGAQALPIISLVSFLVGLILAFVAAAQLEQFGAQIYVANLVVLAMAREMAAMMTGIILAGRTGAAFAAQIGAMTVNEEIDALRTTGLDPMEFIVLPRMLALVLMTPLLCLYANLMGILGGAVVGAVLLDISFLEYWTQTRAAVSLTDFGGGLFKASVYGVIVAVAGCLRGMQCGRSSAAVGAAATSAVVTGIVFIVIASAVLTITYNALGV